MFSSVTCRSDVRFLCVGVNTKDNFDEKVFVLLIFIFGVVFMTYAGYDFGTGHPVKASRILGKGGVYFWKP